MSADWLGAKKAGMWGESSADRWACWMAAVLVLRRAASLVEWSGASKVAASDSKRVALKVPLKAA